MTFTSDQAAVVFSLTTLAFLLGLSFGMWQGYDTGKMMGELKAEVAAARSAK
jgi:hypothetical protein